MRRKRNSCKGMKIPYFPHLFPRPCLFTEHTTSVLPVNSVSLPNVVMTTHNIYVSLDEVACETNLFNQISRTQLFRAPNSEHGLVVREMRLR